MQCVLKKVETITFRKCNFHGHFLSIFVTMLKTIFLFVQIKYFVQQTSQLTQFAD